MEQSQTGSPYKVTDKTLGPAVPGGDAKGNTGSQCRGGTISVDTAWLPELVGLRRGQAGENGSQSSLMTGRSESVLKQDILMEE